MLEGKKRKIWNTLESGTIQRSQKTNTDYIIIYTHTYTYIYVSKLPICLFVDNGLA